VATYIYITIEQAIETHGKTVDVSGGGAKGQLNIGQLDSVLEMIQNDDYYPSFEDKLTHLFFSANKFHCFEDGNKRINGPFICRFMFIRSKSFKVHVASFFKLH
jgi:death-on-curing protein